MANIKCRHCGAKRDPRYGENIDGSWNCPKCGYLNKQMNNDPFAFLRKKNTSSDESIEPKEDLTKEQALDETRMESGSRFTDPASLLAGTEYKQDALAPSEHFSDDQDAILQREKLLEGEDAPSLLGVLSGKMNSAKKKIDTGKEKVQSAKDGITSAKERRIEAREERIREKEERIREKEEAKLQKAENKRIRAEKFHLLLHRIVLGSKIALVLLLVFTVGLTCYEFVQRIPVGYKSNNLLDVSYESVASKLEGSGFTRIKSVGMEDLESSEMLRDGKVASIKIGWKESFDKDQKFPSNFPVTITYHSLKKIPVPFSSEDIVKTEYTHVLDQLEYAGFLNVRTEVRYDIITGLFRGDTEVESVTIDGDSYYKYNALYRPDAEIVVVYHRFLKEKN